MSDGLRFHVDGELVLASEASVSVRDRGFVYGDAAFETLRAYGGALFQWDVHEARLATSCEVLELDHGLAASDLHDRVMATLAANDLADAHVRLSITRGVQSGRLAPSPEVDPTVVVTVESLPRGGLAGDPVWDAPATLRTVSTQRVPDHAIPARAKTHNRLNGILARLELRGTDADEALMLDAEGRVTGGSSSNVFVVDGDGLATPDRSAPVLPGITRATVQDLAREEEIPVRELTLSQRNVLEADEVFCTNSTWEVRPVATVDDRPFETGPVTELLAHRYRERVERECY